MGLTAGEINGRPSFSGHTLCQSAAIVTVASITLSTVRLAVHCMRAIIPSACSIGMLVQLLEWRSRPPAAADKCRLIALAGAWVTAAFCDCTAACDYWLTPAAVSDPLQYLYLPLACASFVVSATAAFLSSYLSGADAFTGKTLEATGKPEEQAPLAAPDVTDTRESIAVNMEEGQILPTPGFVKSYPSSGAVRDIVPAQLQVHWQSVRRCKSQTDGSRFSVAGLPTVSTPTGWGPVDILDKRLPCGSVSVDSFDSDVHCKVLSQPAPREACDRGTGQVEPACIKESAFVPSNIREGGLLAGFSSFDGGKAAFRGAPTETSRSETWPRSKKNELCGWNLRCSTVHCEAHEPAKIGDERHTLERVPSYASTTSRGHTPTNCCTGTGREDNHCCWCRCCCGTSPLLSEFLEKGEEASRQQAEKQASGATGRCDAACGPHSEATHGMQYLSTPISLSAVSHGLDAGWKPYLMKLGFSGSGSYKRDGGRTQRIRDLKWLDVMIVDVEGEPIVGFDVSAASRLCDV